MPHRLHLVASLLAIGLTVAACSSDEDSAGANEPTKTAAQSTAPESTRPEKTTEETESGASPSEPVETVVVEITEEGGQITPLGDTVEVDLGQEIRLIVDSDAADELHVHSEPEQSFDVKAANDQDFTFTIDAPGTYEVESHGLDVVVVKLQVS